MCSLNIKPWNAGMCAAAVQQKFITVEQKHQLQKNWYVRLSRQPNKLVRTIFLTPAWRLLGLINDVHCTFNSTVSKQKTTIIWRGNMRKKEKSTLKVSTGLIPRQGDTQCDARHWLLPRPSWTILLRYRQSGGTQDQASLRSRWGVVFSSPAVPVVRRKWDYNMGR